MLMASCSFSFRSSFVRGVAATALVVLAIASGPVLAQGPPTSGNPRLDARLREVIAGRQNVPQRVIIRARPGHHEAVRRVLRQRGGRVLAEHGSLGAMTAVVHADDLAALGRENGIISVSVDAVVRPNGLLGGLLGGLGATVQSATTTGTGLVGGLLGTTVGLVDGLVDTVGTIIDPNGTTGPPVPPHVLRQTLGLDGTWAGRGIGVALIDSGIEMSAEFKGRVTAFYDMTGGRTEATAPFDDYGHGTHVAGTIAGSGALSSDRAYRGLAPKVHLVVLKVLDENGAGYTSDVIRAVDYAVAHRARLGIDIINLSLGHPIYEPAGTDPLVQAVERASRAGIIVVAAAGNFGKNPTTGLPGYAGITSPGNAPSAITVGAVMTGDTVSRSDDRLAEYSSAGPTWYDAIVKPDIVAPGHGVIAAAARHGTLYRTYPQLRAADPDYMRLSGTSMATAVTTGVVALMLDAQRAAGGAGDPPLTPNAVKAALHYTALDVRSEIGLEHGPLRQGAGALNGRGAIELASAMDTSVPEGAPWSRPMPLPWTAIGGETLVWKQAVVWGNAVIWGSTVEMNHTAWGTAVIWGSTNTFGTAVIWGSNAVWTDPQSWSTAVIWGSHAIGHTDGTAVIWGSSGDMTEGTTVWKDLDEHDVAAASAR
jgi:serine protease AprX